MTATTMGSQMDIMLGREGASGNCNWVNVLHDNFLLLTASED